MAKFELRGTLSALNTRNGKNGEFVEVIVKEEIYNSMTGELLVSTFHQALCFENSKIDVLRQKTHGDRLTLVGSIHSNERKTTDGQTFYSCWLNIRKID